MGIATTIRNQIGIGALMTIGAHQLRNMGNGFAFKAKILPFNKNGKRGQAARKMQVEITRNAQDTYDIKVWYLQKYELKTHYEAGGIYGDQLAKLFVALDFDGPQVLNPRIV